MTSSEQATTEQAQALILDALQHKESIASTEALFSGRNIDNNIVFGALKSLATYEKINYESIESEKWTITDEGSQICTSGSHEYRVLMHVKQAMPTGITSSELEVTFRARVIFRLNLASSLRKSANPFASKTSGSI